MTKKDLVNKIVEETGLQTPDVLPVVTALFDVIKSSLAKGLHIEIRGFGTFANKKRAEKLCRNIKKNEPLLVPAHYLPSFNPSEQFKELVSSSIKVISK